MPMTGDRPSRWTRVLKALKSAIRSPSVQTQNRALPLTRNRSPGECPPDPTRAAFVTPVETSLSHQHVLDLLREVIDPELGHNIVDLGLIYGLEVQEGVIKVTMTMTTPGCPAQDYILSGVDRCCRRSRGVSDVRIDLVWDPPWSPDKMSATARAQSGIGG